MTKAVTRLFQQFQPENYALSLVPDREGMKFSGQVSITGKKVGRPSERITLHQKGLKVISASIVRHDKKGDQSYPVARINNQDSFDEVRLHADAQLYPGNYTVTLEFEGTITTPMHGIYPCEFKHEGKKKQLIATQFESHHAREAFPCIDEPEAKATFDLTLTTPAGETVIANTPVLEQRTNGELCITSFETTPRMSTYLLAFVYGELGYLEATTKDGVLVRTYATPDNVKMTQHSLDVAVKSLEFFGDYFTTPYPLPKLDMIALPDFSSGAMENWGLVTYREVAMLLDETSGSIESKQYIATVVAHELSHQWFGNLVTMKWWDDLWLNESFANMMEYRAVDAIYPEWHIWEQFVSTEGASAKRRDSLADVQPIHCKVSHPDQISSLFDPSIVYAKGGTVLYMLMHFIGEAAFRAGLQNYFTKHQYGNTQAEDLWAALSKASDHDVSAFMANWINNPGYPMISVDWQPGTSEVRLSQQRFYSDPAVAESTQEPWQVPLAATNTLDMQLLTSSGAVATLQSPDSALLLNHNGQSYSLPRYVNSDHRAHITTAIQAGKVGTIDRLLLLDGYTLLQRGGFSGTVDLLELVQAYKSETSENVWGAIAGAIAESRRLIEGDEDSEAKLNAIVAKLVEPLALELGWDDAPDDDASKLHLRGLIISMAAGAKMPAILEEGAKRFAVFKQPSDLGASTRSIVYFIAARYGSQADFDKLLQLHNSSSSAEDRDEYAGALTSVKESDRYHTILKMLTGTEIRRQDLMHWYVWLLRNRYARADAWTWLKDHWSWIEVEYASDKSYSYFARYGGSIFSHREELDKFSEFFEPKKSIVALTRDITLAQQEITSRVAWRERNEAAVKAWLK
ncbi:M1 family metallopeptidase [Polaromonas sp.]|nr:M1 family metallopeptidase [Candidatus Saccharibacteria bacterium]